MPPAVRYHIVDHAWDALRDMRDRLDGVPSTEFIAPAGFRPSKTDVLNREDLRQLKQRIAVRFELKPC